MESKYFVNSSVNILIVDDRIEDMVVLIQTLKKYQYKISLATDVSLALKYVRASPPDLIVFNINISNINHSQLDYIIKQIQKSQNIPVIFIGNLDNFNTANLNTGNFNTIEDLTIAKPFKVAELIVTIENQVKLKFIQAEINNLNFSLVEKIQKPNCQLVAKIDSEGWGNKFPYDKGSFHQSQWRQEELLPTPLYDALTKLPNRSLLLQKLQKELDTAYKNPDYQFAILCFDSDNFKVINYSLGYNIGDALLKALPSRFQSSLPKDSFIARLGGDEFVIVLSNLNSLENAIAVTQNIQQALIAPFKIKQQEIVLNFSIGIVLGNREYDQPEQLLSSADLAIYQAKTSGKRQYQVYNKQMHQLAVERLQLEVDLRKALKNREFVLYYQPIICLKTGSLAGFESLIRWQHPQLGMISPNKFIPIAEETGLIIPLGIWILQEACRQLKIWHQQYNSTLSLTININVAVQQFADDNLMNIIDQTLAENNLPAHCLKLEITESAIMQNSTVANLILQQFKERNIKICIDDFGTGYSSLSYLHQFPVDNLKIDRSFVSRIDPTNKPHKIIDAIANLAHHLDMTVTAEGIETAAQLQYVANLGCEYGQGYYFSPPLNAQQIEARNLLSPQKHHYLKSHNSTPVTRVGSAIA